MEGALLGLGVDFFRLLLAEGVLRDARAFAFGKPCPFFAFGSSDGTASCISGCVTIVGASSGGVCVCAAEVVWAKSEGASKGCFRSTGACVGWL